MTSDGTILGTRQVYSDDVAPFKYKYTLLDDTGNPVEEPDEADLATLSRMRTGLVCCTNMCYCVFILIVLAMLAFRFYLWSCFRQFNMLTMWQMNGRPWPAPDADLKSLVEQCHQAVRGTGTPVGTPCRPSNNQTYQVCVAIPETNRPEAFQALMYEWFEQKVSGIPCYHGVCHDRNRMVEQDPHGFIGISTIIVLFLVMKLVVCCANQSMKRYKKGLQKNKAQHIQETRLNGTQQAQMASMNYSGQQPGYGQQAGLAQTAGALGYATQPGVPQRSRGR